MAEQHRDNNAEKIGNHQGNAIYDYSCRMAGTAYRIAAGLIINTALAVKCVLEAVDKGIVERMNSHNRKWIR